VLLDGDAGPTQPWWWGWRLAGACWWRRDGASGCAGLDLPEEAMWRQGGARATGLVKNMWHGWC
jgi:hypothetical protein